MVRDYAAFMAAAPNHFTEEYKTAYRTKLTEVENQVGIRNYWAQMKNITEDLGLKMTEIRPVLRKFEVNLNLAKKNLTISVKDFGLKELRKEVSKGNVEGAITAWGTILKNISDNKDLLKDKGFKDAQLTEMTGLRDSIRTLNQNQNLKTDEKEEAIRKNWQGIEELWDITKEVMDTGKNLYYFDNPQKAKDYMVTSLKRRVNKEREAAGGDEEPETEIGMLALIVLNKSNDEPLLGAEIEIVETGDVDLTDEEGEGGAELPVGKYTVKVRMEGFVEQTISNVEIKKDETTEMTVKMEPEATA